MINLPEVPSRIKKLQKNEKGYPVPWFVQWIDGKPDFRVMDSNKWIAAVKLKLCWTCGEPMGKFKAFVIGPMCAVNRTSSEPPSHRECAEFSARACPFLTEPKRVRREAGMPPGWETVGGVSIRRNPGVALVWITKSYKVFRAPGQEGVKVGVLIEIGDPVKTLWFAEGREATYAEVMESIKTGLPLLQSEALKEGDDALRALDAQVAVAMKYVPVLIP